MKYIIRLDDICPGMDWDKFWRVKEIFLKHGQTAVLGIIPDNKDPQFKHGQPESVFRKEIDELIYHGWEIAQHGHTHELTQGSGELKLYPKGEFPGLPASTQRTKINEGKEKLDGWGWDVKYFYPPAHAYDKNTLDVLKLLGYEALLDGIGFYPWMDEGLLHIPQIWWKPSKLPIPFRWLNGTIIICLHPFHMKEMDFVKLDHFLANTTLTNVRETVRRGDQNSKLNSIAKLIFQVKQSTTTIFI